MMLAKNYAIELPGDYMLFKAKMEEIIAKKAQLPNDYMFDLSSQAKIQIFCTWKARVLPGGKKCPTLAEFVQLTDKDDYEGVISDIRASFLTQKNGIEKNCFYIIGRVTSTMKEKSQSAVRTVLAVEDVGEDCDETDFTLSPERKVFSNWSLEYSNM